MRVMTTIGAKKGEVSGGSCVTIGNFDGVHRGHQMLLSQVMERREQGCQGGLVTFDPHPVAVIAPEKAPHRLCTLERRLKLVEDAGLDFVLVIPFDKAFSQTEPEDFIQRILVEQLGIRHVVVGPDCRFGKARRGDAALLEKESQQYGFTVSGVSPLMEDDIRVSSSAIRRAISTGEVAHASRMLGRPHRLPGTVIRGDQRGREIGFPTANLDLPERLLLPLDGVYAGQVTLPTQGTTHSAVVNVGVRPTIGGDKTSVEVHLLDFSGDLYGQELYLDVWERLRGEQRFESLAALGQQIAQDVSRSREVLGESP